MASSEDTSRSRQATAAARKSVSSMKARFEALAVVGGDCSLLD